MENYRMESVYLGRNLISKWIFVSHIFLRTMDTDNFKQVSFSCSMDVYTQSLKRGGENLDRFRPFTPFQATMLEIVLGSPTSFPSMFLLCGAAIAMRSWSRKIVGFFFLLFPRSFRKTWSRIVCSVTEFEARKTSGRERV